MDGRSRSSVPAKMNLLDAAPSSLLDTFLGCRDHRVSRSMWTRRGPMLLATAWSLKTGQVTVECPRDSCSRFLIGRAMLARVQTGSSAST